MVKQTAGNRVGTGKPGPGRTRGVPNKVSTSAREIVLTLLRSNADVAQQQLDRLRRSPRLWMSAYTRLAALVVPRVLPRDGDSTPLVNINIGTTPITDAASAAAIYAEVIGRPDVDLSGLRFAAIEHEASAHTPAGCDP